MYLPIPPPPPDNMIYDGRLPPPPASGTTPPGLHSLNLVSEGLDLIENLSVVLKRLIMCAFGKDKLSLHPRVSSARRSDDSYQVSRVAPY